MIMDKPLAAGNCSTYRVVARRRKLTRGSGMDTVGRSVFCRGHGLLAVLLMADRSSVIDAFAGLAVGAASGMRVGSTSSEGPYRNEAGGLGSRLLLRQRCTTLSPTTDAEEERVLAEESPSPNGSEQEGIGRKTATLNREQRNGAEGEVNGDKRNTAAGTRQNGRRQGGQATTTVTTTSRRGDRIVSFAELNSRRVDPALVRPSVLHYLQTPRTLTSYQFVNLGMASCRHSDIHIVTEVCETARSMGITTNVRFMTKLVNAASKERRWVMAVQLLQLMRSYGVTPNDVTFTSILSEMAKAKQHHMASEMLRTEGLQDDLCAYNALISGCTSSRAYTHALRYFNDMMREGVRPDTMTFSSLIATTRDGTDTSVERAFGTLEMMKKAGVLPNTYCMNSIMGVSVQARQPNTALEIFKEMERDGIPRDVVSYNTAIAACDKLGDAPAAVRLLQQAKESSVEPDIFSYNSVISALGHSSLWQEAFQVFEEMHADGVEPCLMTYNTLIAGCVRAEHPEEALSVFNMMKERNIKRDQYSYAGALHACMHLRDSDLSVTLLEEMEASGMPANAEGYATAIRTCARCGDIHKATTLYAQSLKLAIVPTAITYRALLEAYAEVKSAERAVWVFDEMRDLRIDVEQGHLYLVLGACTDEANIALRVLRLNEELELRSRPKMYAKALDICIAGADYESSATVVDMMTAAGLQPEPEQEKRMLQACFDPSQHNELGELEENTGAASEEERREGSAERGVNEE